MPAFVLTPAAVTKTMGRLPFRIPIPSLVFNFTGCWPAANSASMVSLVFCVKTFFVLKKDKKTEGPNEGVADGISGDIAFAKSSALDPQNTRRIQGS